MSLYEYDWPQPYWSTTTTHVTVSQPSQQPPQHVCSSHKQILTCPVQRVEECCNVQDTKESRRKREPHATTRLGSSWSPDDTSGMSTWEEPKLGATFCDVIGTEKRTPTTHTHQTTKPQLKGGEFPVERPKKQ